MKVWIYFLFIVLSSVVQAKERVSSSQEQASAQFYEELKSKKEIAELRQQCSQQERDNHFPDACIRLMRKQMLAFSSPIHWREAWKKISSKCSQTAEHESSLETLERAHRESALGKKCHEKVKSRLEDLSYIAKKTKESKNLAPILNSIPP